jgi:hypothetical protein
VLVSDPNPLPPPASRPVRGTAAAVAGTFRLLTMPSRPSLQAWRNTSSPSSHSMCSLNWKPEPALASTDTSVALHTSNGSRRRSSLLSSRRSNAYKNTLPSWCRLADAFECRDAGVVAGDGQPGSRVGS